MSIKKTLARFALQTKKLRAEREKLRIEQIAHRREVADAFERLNQELIAKVFEEAQAEILAHGIGCRMELVAWKDGEDLHGRNYTVGTQIHTGKTEGGGRSFSCELEIHGDVDGHVVVRVTLENEETVQETVPIQRCDRAWLETRIHEFIQKVFAI